MRRASLGLGLVLVLAASQAWAQSKRYPPEPPDRDREAEAHSQLWESALDPARAPYQTLVHDAKRLLAQHEPDAAKMAIEKLDQAVTLAPGEPEAYGLRGDAYLRLRDWKKCADDLGVAEDHVSAAEAADHWEERVELGVCQARAGRLADAERTLAGAAGTNPRGETWMRLGEVRIAMGKLEEAIDALTAAVEAGNGPHALIHWLLASAYDRARRPGEAAVHARRAAAFDRSFTTIVAPTYPLLGPGEAEYMMGLAYGVEPARPEYVQLYFRRFLALAPDSPWRRRAEEHLRGAATMDPTVERRTGNASVDLPAATAAVKKAMPALRACLAKLPNTLFEVTVTRVGPRTPRAAHDRPRYVMPPAGVSSVPVLNLESVARPDLDAASRCLEPIASHLALPAPHERDTFYRLSFLVVAK